MTNQTKAIAIDLKDLSFGIRTGFLQTRKSILKSLNLEFKTSSITAIVGPNGAGKTTMLHLILGLKNPETGMIRIMNTPHTDPSIRKKIGFVPERPYLPDNETGENILKFFGTLSGEGADLVEKIPAILKLVHLYDARAVQVRNYSKGMLQRLLIAQALLHDPDLFLLDEPFSGLDPDGHRQVQSLVKELQRQGKTILFTTHAIEDVEWMATDLLLLSKGNIEYFGSAPEYLKQHPAVYEILLNDQSVVQCKDDADLKKALAANTEIHSIKQRRPSIEQWYQK